MNHHYQWDFDVDQPRCSRCNLLGTREIRSGKAGIGFIDRPVRGCSDVNKPAPDDSKETVR